MPTYTLRDGTMLNLWRHFAFGPCGWRTVIAETPRVDWPIEGWGRSRDIAKILRHEFPTCRARHRSASLRNRVGVFVNVYRGEGNRSTRATFKAVEQRILELFEMPIEQIEKLVEGPTGVLP